MHSQSHSCIHGMGRARRMVAFALNAHWLGRERQNREKRGRNWENRIFIHVLFLDWTIGTAGFTGPDRVCYRVQHKMVGIGVVDVVRLELSLV